MDTVFAFIASGISFVTGWLIGLTTEAFAAFVTGVFVGLVLPWLWRTFITPRILKSQPTDSSD